MEKTIAEKMALMRSRQELPPPSTRRHLRLAAGLSQQDIADALGVTHVTVGRWETGERTPGDNLLRGYLALLHELATELAGAAEDKGGVLESA